MEQPQNKAAASTEAPGRWAWRGGTTLLDIDGEVLWNAGKLDTLVRGSLLRHLRHHLCIHRAETTARQHIRKRPILLQVLFFSRTRCS